MKTLLILFLFLPGFHTELNAQDLVKPIASKWMVHRQCSDPLDLFQNNVPKGTVWVWDLVLEIVNANQLTASRDENNNMKSIDYSIIAEKNTVDYYFGQLKDYAKEDYFQTIRQSYKPYKAADGVSDSIAPFEGTVYYVYPPPEKLPIAWWDITGIRVRFDSVPHHQFKATWIGFEYQNTAMEEAVWFKPEDLKNAITNKVFVDWLDKLEQSESVGFQYMHMNGSCPEKFGDARCLKANVRYVSVKNSSENGVLFEHQLDIERSCLLTCPNQFSGTGLTSDYAIRSGWSPGLKTYGYKNHYESELLDSVKGDLFEFRIFPNLEPLVTIDGEDSMAVINGSHQFIYPAPTVHAFNLSDWNEIRIRETFNEKTQSFEPNLITYVITRGDVSFELLHVNFQILNQLIQDPENYDWFQFIRDKKYVGKVFYQTSF